MSYVSITHLKPIFPSYGNQSTVLHGESTYWFLYDRRIGLKWFEHINKTACTIPELFLRNTFPPKDSMKQNIFP